MGKANKSKKADPLPKEVFLCEEHFSPEQFDSAVDLKIKLLPQTGIILIISMLVFSAIVTSMLGTKR